MVTTVEIPSQVNGRSLNFFFAAALQAADILVLLMPPLFVAIIYVF